MLNDWSDFLDGSVVRCKTRYKALNETAVFGRACKHEFLKQFFGLKHGEW